jgi:hypothetical protein
VRGTVLAMYRTSRRDDEWGRYLRIDDVHHAVVDQNVRQDDLCLVDIDGAVFHAQSQVGALERLDGAILNVGRIVDGADNDVVLEDAAKHGGGQVSEKVANAIESSVVGCENGDILGRVDGVNHVGLV